MSAAAGRRAAVELESEGLMHSTGDDQPTALTRPRMSKLQTIRYAATTIGILLLLCVMLYFLYLALSGGTTDPLPYGGWFPPHFSFGAATAAYQIEGAWNRDGRAPSIWDDFVHRAPSPIAHGDTGDVATDSYARFATDIELLKQTGFDSYRFSISWSRLLPSGKPASLNALAVAHYNKLIDSLIAVNVTPIVTLYHWDLPSALHTSYGGWLSPASIDDFNAYADVCFREFGDRVRRWITFNEPQTFSWYGYGTGLHAPGRAVNASVEPYVVAHHVILAHARAANTYHGTYAHTQRGEIGITINSNWFEPFDTSVVDGAVTAALEFEVGWFADPIFGATNDYPPIMRQHVGARLPAFTPADQLSLKNAKTDFFGLNHYTTNYVALAPVDGTGWEGDRGVKATFVNSAGEPIGPVSDSDWLYVYPPGIRQLMSWITDRYSSSDESVAGIPIWITENGVDVPNDPMHDQFRIDYYDKYLREVLLAVQTGVNVRGYIAWSLLDNFEWAEGFSKRFGLYHTNYTDQSRTPKASAFWFQRLINSTAFPDSEL